MSFKDLYQKLKEDNKPIYLYGMGNGAEKILDTLDAHSLCASGVFVSDGFVRDKTFRGFKIMSYADACRECADFTVLVAFGTQLPEVIDNVKRIASERTLFAPDTAVFGDGILDIDYCVKNREKLEKVYSLLADEVSKHTFESIVKYKITGDINYLFECETKPESAYCDVLRLSEKENYLDLGAYRGDTVEEFLKYSDGSIIALEPDKKTFTKLVKNVGDKAKCINAAISDKTGKGSFDMQSGRGSHLVSGGENSIDTMSIDDICEGFDVTYIKMDVEGAEERAISGAVKTLQTKKPKLNIAAYHRAFDIVDIPLSVLDINPDYKLYLRHFPYLPAWDTNYYFI